MIAAIARNELVWCTREYGLAGDRPGRESPRCGRGGSHLPRVDVVEHEVRSLLNLVGLISHCLRTCDATEIERAQWRQEAERANARLARLRAAGWCPTLLR